MQPAARPATPPWPAIARRDFLQGAALALPGASAAASPDESAAAVQSTAFPPPDHTSLRTGLQGQTDEVNRAAHAGRDHPQAAADEAAERDEAIEDLVVVGAGISGLAGAHLFARHAGRPVRILLLDALDDVGGHARRNEFISRSGQRLIGYGGSQSLDSPGLFSPAMHSLLQDLGIELGRFKTEFFDADWAKRHGLTQRGIYFSREAWGEETMVVPGAEEADADWLARTPLSKPAQADLVRLRKGEDNPLPQLKTVTARRSALAGMTYAQFLGKHWRVGPEVQRYLQVETQGYFGVGIDATSALDAWAGGLPGFASMDLGQGPDPRNSPSGRHLMLGQDEYIYHFPDGNAGLARALLRRLIPAALPLPTAAEAAPRMEDLSDAVMDLRALDQPESAVRLRLRATVLGLRHIGPPREAELVEIRYRDGEGKLRSVRARQALLACWHRVIARLTDEIPAAQRKALGDQVKVPLLYGNVLLNNWRAFARAGLHSIQPVGGFWAEASLDFPVRMGRNAPPESPDQPVLLHLAKVVVPGNGQPERIQASQGRAMLLGWRFEEIEGETRRMLQGALGAWGFDHARDIEAITVNRWAHGYAYEYMRPWDAYWPRGPLPCEVARRGWGRVAIANSDAGAFAYAHSAVDQATRAVQELLPEAHLPAWHRGVGPPMPGPLHAGASGPKT